MHLSVVVPTLNGQERLRACLDSLADHAPGAEVVVVNGPSTDGTTGMVRDRDDVDVLLEVADRNLNVARNAGIGAASGEAVALVNYDFVVESDWADAVRKTLADADVATGPTHRTLDVGVTTEPRETDTVAGTSVTFFNGDNVAFRREAVEAIDGFDEYLRTGGARDSSHRLARLGRTVAWNGDMAVRGEFETDGGTVERDWSSKYRALAYRMNKSYGPRPATFGRVVAQVVEDCSAAIGEVARGKANLTSAVGGLRSTVSGATRGSARGLLARVRDRSPTRNPHGLSSRYDRAVRVYDWR
jgi:glycosyltransferase involved in cell wall biosynthesis